MTKKTESFYINWPRLFGYPLFWIGTNKDSCLIGVCSNLFEFQFGDDARILTQRLLKAIQFETIG